MELVRIDPSKRVAMALGAWQGPKPTPSGWQGKRVDPAYQTLLAMAYDKAPTLEGSSLKYWRAMASEVDRQYAHLRRFVAMEVVAHDPYDGGDIRLMREAVEGDGVLKVMATATTGGHPVWSNELNDKFRFVHDCFGHLATGNATDRHGEYGAFLHHMGMFSDASVPAIVTELQGQNAWQIVFGDFGPQKVADMGLRREDFR